MVQHFFFFLFLPFFFLWVGFVSSCFLSLTKEKLYWGKEPTAALPQGGAFL